MDVLEEAAALINGDRQEQYGNATESHTRIADLWSAYLNTDVTEFDVVNMMVLLKVSRTKQAYHRDSYVDIAGYAGLGERLHDESPDGPDSYTIEVTKESQPWLLLLDDEPADDGGLADWKQELLDAVKKPRVWQSFDGIPHGVNVRDKDGDTWATDEVEDQLTDRRNGKPYGDKWGPFTEVLETA